MKKLGVAVLVIGALLVMGALAMQFFVAGQAQFPEDVDTTRTYDGTLLVLLNEQALASGELGNLFLKDIPVTISRHVTTEQVDGKKGLVREFVVMTGPGDRQLQLSDKWYAIDRQSMEAIEGTAGLEEYAKRAIQADTNLPDPLKQAMLLNPIPEREGLVIGWPIGSGKKDYTGWNGDTLDTVTLTYEEKETITYEDEGKTVELDIYVFKASSSAKEIKDPLLLARLPKALPKEMLVQLAATLDLSDAMKERFQEILPTLPDPVPLVYTYEYEATYWVEPTTGVLVDTEKHETRKAALEIEGMPVPVPLTEVYELEYRASEQSVKDAAQDAEDNMGTLNAVKTLFPVMIVVGLVLVVGGLMLMFIKHEPDEAAAA